MDVSIRSADKQQREAAIKARDDKQAAQDRRAEKRKARREARRGTVITKRLRRRIAKRVRADLLTEKKLFLSGQATGGEYYISTRVRYKSEYWRRNRQFVESILQEVLAQHTGFEHKVDYECDDRCHHKEPDKEWCIGIKISYTLQNI